MTHPAPPAPEPDLQKQTALHLQQVMLALTDQSADVARMIHIEAKAAFEAAPPGATPVTDRARVFDNAARAVRRAAMLAHKYGQPIPLFDHARHRARARQSVIRAVEDNIQRHAPYGDADSLHEELLERLDGPDLEDAIDTRPVAEIITELCRDLGLDIIPGADPWVRRTPADIAILCDRAAAPGQATAPVHQPIPLPQRQDIPRYNAETGHPPDRGRSRNTA